MAIDLSAPLREVPEFKIKYSDVFHLKNLYIMLHEYLVDEQWTGDGGMAVDPSDTHKDIEKFYYEKHHQKAIHRGGTEIWVWWRLKKNPFGKNNNYYQFTMDIDFHGVYLQKQEIMHQGKKIKVDKGELEISFRPKLVRWSTALEWQNHWLLKHVQDIYERRIIEQDLDKLEKELWRESYKVQAVVKQYLNLRNFIPVAEPFHPTLYGMEGQS